MTERRQGQSLATIDKERRIGAAIGPALDVRTTPAGACRRAPAPDRQDKQDLA
jgi:hypothetical protein